MPDTSPTAKQSQGPPMPDVQGAPKGSAPPPGGTPKKAPPVYKSLPVFADCGSAPPPIPGAASALPPVPGVVSASPADFVGGLQNPAMAGFALQMLNVLNAEGPEAFKAQLSTIVQSTPTDQLTNIFPAESKPPTDHQIAHTM